MRNLLLLLTLSLAAAPSHAQQPPTLDAAVETLATYPVTKTEAPADVVAALEVVSKAVATPEVLPPAIKARLDALLENKQPTPTPKNQIKLNDPLSLALVRYENRLLDALPPEKITAYRGAADFPGAVANGAIPITKTIQFNAATPGRHSLGLYAAPGAKITVTVPGHAATIKAKSLSVLIGTHSDVLYTAAGGRKSAQRLPNLIRSFPIEGNTTLAANPAGGLVYIVSPTGTIPGKLPVEHNANPTPDPITIKVEGAVASPLFWRGQTTAADWKKQIATATTPWAEVGSDWIVLTMPIEEARSIADPEKLTADWDKIASNNYTLIGYGPDHKPIRPERFVADVQISAGAAHAGYPLIVPVSWAKRFSDPEQLRTGNNWGLYHELGHNFQNPNWSFSGNGEVTCNLFVFLAHHHFNQPMWDEKTLSEQRTKIKTQLAKGDNLWETGDNFSRLLFWHEMIQAIGFEPFQKAFAETLRSPVPKDETEKRQLLMTRLSRASHKNLAPYFEKWGILPTTPPPADIAAFPLWMPQSLN